MVDHEKLLRILNTLQQMIETEFDPTVEQECTRFLSVLDAIAGTHEALIIVGGTFFCIRLLSCWTSLGCVLGGKKRV